MKVYKAIIITVLDFVTLLQNIKPGFQSDPQIHRQCGTVSGPTSGRTKREVCGLNYNLPPCDIRKND